MVWWLLRRQVDPRFDHRVADRISTGGFDRDAAEHGGRELGSTIQPRVDRPRRLEADGESRGAIGQRRRPLDPAVAHRDVAIEQFYAAARPGPSENDPHGDWFGRERHLGRHGSDRRGHEVIGEVEAVFLNEHHVPAGMAAVGGDHAGERRARRGDQVGGDHKGAILEVGGD